VHAAYRTAARNGTAAAAVAPLLTRGGSVVVVRGRNFGAARDAECGLGSAQEPLRIRIGGRACLETVWRSDAEAECVAPPGVSAAAPVDASLCGLAALPPGFVGGSPAAAAVTLPYTPPTVSAVELVPSSGGPAVRVLVPPPGPRQALLSTDPAGGEELRVFGSSFGAASASPALPLPRISIGPYDCAPASTLRVNDTLVVCLSTPPAGGANRSVTVDVAGQAAVTGPVAGYLPPLVDVVFPSSGLPQAGGATVAIIGRGFGLGAAVAVNASVGGRQCLSVRRESDRRLDCVVPPGVGYSRRVGVVVAGQASLDGFYGSVAVAYDLPAVTAIAPPVLMATAGPASSPVNVTLLGRSFGLRDGDISAVRVGGAPCGQVVRVSAGRIDCRQLDTTRMDPAAPPWEVVLDGDATAAPRGNASLLVVVGRPSVVSADPALLDAGGGTRLSVLGSGFGTLPQHVAGVLVDGLPCASVTVVSQSLLRCVAPRGAGRGVGVQVVGGGGLRSPTNTLVSFTAPRIDAVSPRAALVDSSTVLNLTFTGSGLGVRPGDVGSVSFGGFPCPSWRWENSSAVRCLGVRASGLGDGTPRVVVRNQSSSDASGAGGAGGAGSGFVRVRDERPASAPWAVQAAQRQAGPRSVVVRVRWRVSLPDDVTDPLQALPSSFDLAVASAGSGSGCEADPAAEAAWATAGGGLCAALQGSAAASGSRAVVHAVIPVPLERLRAWRVAGGGLTGGATVDVEAEVQSPLLPPPHAAAILVAVRAGTPAGPGPWAVAPRPASPQCPPGHVLRTGDVSRWEPGLSSRMVQAPGSPATGNATAAHAWACERCPAGADCGAGWDEAGVASMPGFWRVPWSPGAGVHVRCLDPSACSGPADAPALAAASLWRRRRDGGNASAAGRRLGLLPSPYGQHEAAWGFVRGRDPAPPQPLAPGAPAPAWDSRAGVALPPSRGVPERLASLDGAPPGPASWFAAPSGSTSSPAALAPLEPCSPNRQGAMCGKCAPGFAAAGAGHCEPCPSPAYLAGATVLTLLGLLAVGTAAAVSAVGRATGVTREGAEALRLVLPRMQLLLALLSLPVVVPPALRGLLVAFDALAAPPGAAALPVECLAPALLSGGAASLEVSAAATAITALLVGVVAAACAVRASAVDASGSGLGLGLASCCRGCSIRTAKRDARTMGKQARRGAGKAVLGSRSDAQGFGTAASGGGVMEEWGFAPGADPSVRSTRKLGVANPMAALRDTEDRRADRKARRRARRERDAKAAMLEGLRKGDGAEATARAVMEARRKHTKPQTSSMSSSSSSSEDDGVAAGRGGASAPATPEQRRHSDAAEAIGLALASATGEARGSSAAPSGTAAAPPQSPVAPARDASESLFRRKGMGGSPESARRPVLSPKRDAETAKARKMARWASGPTPEPSCCAAAAAGVLVGVGMLYTPLSLAALRLVACTAVGGPDPVLFLTFALDTPCDGPAMAARWAVAAPLVAACTIGFPVLGALALLASSGSLETAAVRAWLGPLFLHTRYDESYAVGTRNGGVPSNPWLGGGARGGTAWCCDNTGRAPCCPSVCLACTRWSGADPGDEGPAGGVGLGAVVPRCCGRRATAPLTLFTEPSLFALRGGAVAVAALGVPWGAGAQSLVLAAEALFELLLVMWLKPYRTPLLNGVAVAGAAVQACTAVSLVGPASGVWPASDAPASAAITVVVYLAYLVPVLAGLGFAGSKWWKHCSRWALQRRERAARLRRRAEREARKLEAAVAEAERVDKLAANPLRDPDARRKAIEMARRPSKAVGGGGADGAARGGKADAEGGATSNPLAVRRIEAAAARAAASAKAREASQEARRAKTEGMASNPMRAGAPGSAGGRGAGRLASMVRPPSFRAPAEGSGLNPLAARRAVAAAEAARSRVELLERAAGMDGGGPGGPDTQGNPMRRGRPKPAAVQLPGTDEVGRVVAVRPARTRTRRAEPEPAPAAAPRPAARPVAGPVAQPRRAGWGGILRRGAAPNVPPGVAQDGGAASRLNAALNGGGGGADAGAANPLASRRR